MGLRFYRRTGPNSAYSHGVVLEGLRPLWFLFGVLLFAGAVVGAVEGNAGSAFLCVGLAFGGWLGLRRRP
jgi:hypothetical protein